MHKQTGMSASPCSKCCWPSLYKPQKTADDYQFKLHTHEGSLGHKYIEVVCGGRSSSLLLDNFIKLVGMLNVLNVTVSATQEFEAMTGNEMLEEVDQTQ